MGRKSCFGARLSSRRPLVSSQSAGGRCVLIAARAWSGNSTAAEQNDFGRRDSWSRFWVLSATGGVALAAAEGRRTSSSSCSTTQRVNVGKAEDFAEGEMREVAAGPEGSKATVLMHKHNGIIYATSPACSHYGAALRKGVTASGGRGMAPTITCPLHDATFDLTTGQVVRGPSIDGIAVYKVEVKNGGVFVDVPKELAAGESKHQKVARGMCRRDQKDKRVFVLLGSGPASLAAAETLRQEGFGGRVVLLTKEPHLPYDRVQLSKKLDATAESLQLRPAEFFEKNDIEVVHGANVTSVDAKSREVKYKVGNTEECLKYDKALVATGGTPRKLFCPGANLKGIFTLRTPEDAADIAKYAKPGQKLVVVGGSFIGMEVASTLRKKGCDVAVVAMETVPFERVLGKKVGASFARMLQKEGVEWFGTAQVRLFRGNAGVNGVELEDGEVLPADAVVIGAGVLPNTRFLEGVALDKNGAIMVNPLLASESESSLFAAGDVCAYPALMTGTRVRIEHWDVATQQGRVAARNMLGQYVPFTTTPFFWSQLFGKNMRFVGHAPEALDRVIIEGDVAGMEFISYYTEDDEIRAVATVNKDPVAVACAELMRRGKMPKVSELILGVVNAEVIMERLRDLKTTPA